jgi:hypothetical protein
MQPLPQSKQQATSLSEKKKRELEADKIRNEGVESPKNDE